MNNTIRCVEWIDPVTLLPEIPKGNRWVVVLVSVEYEDACEAIFTDRGFCWDMVDYNDRSFLNDCVNHWMYPVRSPKKEGSL